MPPKNYPFHKTPINSKTYLIITIGLIIITIISINNVLQRQTQPTHAAQQQTNTPPGFECMGGINCTPSISPSTTINPNPISTTNPLPTTNPSDPCSNTTQSVTNNQKIIRHRKNNKNSNNNNSNKLNSTGLIQQFLELLIKLLNMIIQLIGGNPIPTPTPPPSSPVPQPTPCEPTPTNPPATSTAPQPSMQPSNIPPAPQSNYPASDGNILWEAGWETGDTSQWSVHTGGSWGDSSAEADTSTVRYGKYAGKLTLNPGSGNVRAEISANQKNTGGYDGQEWFYSFSVYFPSNPTQNTGWSEWNVITQWMDMRANCSPPIAIDITSNHELILSNQITYQESGNCGYGTLPHTNYPLGKITYDQWIDFTVRLKWSEDPQVGFAQVWKNGQEVLPLTNMQTLDPGSTGVYMEQDLYRPDPTGQAIIYIDGTRRHDSYQGIKVNTLPSL